VQLADGSSYMAKLARDIIHSSRVRVVTTDRGGRSELGALKRRWREWRRSAYRSDYLSLVQRFALDPVFRQSRIAEGYTVRDFEAIDRGQVPPFAWEAAQRGVGTGARSYSQRAHAESDRYRNVAFARPGELDPNRADVEDRTVVSERARLASYPVKAPPLQRDDDSAQWSWGSGWGWTWHNDQWSSGRSRSAWDDDWWSSRRSWR
jgi:hypothetical protein